MGNSTHFSTFPRRFAVQESVTNARTVSQGALRRALRGRRGRGTPGAPLAFKSAFKRQRHPLWVLLQMEKVKLTRESLVLFWRILLMVDSWTSSLEATEN